MEQSTARKSRARGAGGFLVALGLTVCVGGCGKKGPPLAPLYLVPERPAGVEAHVIDDTVFVQMTVPAKNANGGGAIALDHLDVFAITVPPGSTTPPNTALLNRAHLIARIPVKPPVDENEPAAEGEHAAPDTRPGPGERITFAEPLGDKQRTPEAIAAPKTKAPAAAADSVSAGALPPVANPAASPASSANPSRIYVVRGVTRSGRPGPQSSRASVPLVAPPPAPGALDTHFTETAVTLTWVPPVTETPTTLTFNVYAAKTAAPAEAVSAGLAERPAPLNDHPLNDASFEHAGAAPGIEQCFVVRAVKTAGDVGVEGAASPAACVTPRDIFPPSVPKGLAIVALSGAMSLIWDANTEADLEGYLVLRGEAPGDTLQPLTPQPIRETRFTDNTVRPGVRYVYAIVAVDRANPPNASAPSARVEETAR